MSNIKYQGVIQLSEKNNAHTIAFDYVNTLSAGEKLKILEVGCSTAYFGSFLKSHGHTVWGIEPTELPAKVASEKLDYVFKGYVEDFIQIHSDQRFDVIVFGDVLEHIPDPKLVLVQCHHLLKAGGAIIASVPNVSHITIRTMLLEGNWQYSDLGIMDKTHLRFFTRHSIQELFYRSSYCVHDIQPVKVPANAVAHMCRMGLNLDLADQIDNLVHDDTKLDFQYVLMATPIKAANGEGATFLSHKEKIKVLGLAIDTNSSHAEVRMIKPLEAWANTSGGLVNFSNFVDCGERLIQWADIVVIQRHIDDTVFKLLSLARKHNKKVIYESDDFMLNLPPHLSHHLEALKDFGIKMNTLLPQVDCVTATTHRLAKHQFQPFNRPTIVIPNCSLEDNLSSINSATWKNGHATLIVASSDKVLVDFILPAMAQLTERTDVNVSVIVIGPPGDAFDHAGIVCQRVPNLSYDEFKLFIRTIDNPIGIIPLDDSLFSNCKTAIKYFDYSMAGIPVVCSNVPPYSDVIEHTKHGLLTHNETDEWVDAIMQLVNSVVYRERLVYEAKALVQEDFNQDKAVLEWDILLKDLMRNRYAFNPPTDGLKRKVGFKKLFDYLFDLNAYRHAYRFVRFHGIRTLIKKFF